jgi:hypothetical protein
VVGGEAGLLDGLTSRYNITGADIWDKAVVGN